MWGDVRALTEQLHGGLIHQQELGLVAQTRDRIALLQLTAEGTVDAGTQAAQAIHHEIANIPFTILESIPVTRDAASAVLGVHDAAAKSIYGVISTVNRALGQQLREVKKCDTTL